MGVEFFSGGEDKSFLSDILVEGCRIERTGFTGIGIHSSNKEEEYYNSRILILDNELRDIGGPGIQPGRGKDILVRGNIVDGSGSRVDGRMHGRGSGIWPWTCRDVLIERNKFMHARGKADSCGVHIDFNCSNVVVQYNLSVDNEGGFVEILGNNWNCAYRYNISINDGARIKRQAGATQEGKVLWLSSFTGGGNPRSGPFNSYIYNNTIYVSRDRVVRFSVTPSASGALIANNIFYIPGGSEVVKGDQDSKLEAKGLKTRNIVVTNNICVGELPASIFPEIRNLITEDPAFKRGGGSEARDYVCGNLAAVKDKGIRIGKLAGDEVGLVIGLRAESDYFGNRIRGLPDIGAIELPLE
jgi:hypothetical protein